MSAPVQFDGANGVLVAPVGVENVGDLPVFRNGVCCISCWEVSEAELTEIAASRRVYVSVFSGKTQPAIFVGSETAVRDIAADYGVWKR